jgi:hypothetical protein
MAIKESLIEFIKPNKWKIVLGILLLIIFVAIGAMITDICMCREPNCSNCPIIPTNIKIISGIIFAPYSFAYFIVREGNAALSLSPIFFLIYYYIISCIIVTIYNKIKSKKK